MPELSTPPRVRHRSKTMTSASQRPSALRNGGSTKSRGRSPVRTEKKEKKRDRERKKSKKSKAKEAAGKRKHEESEKKTEKPKDKKCKVETKADGKEKTENEVKEKDMNSGKAKKKKQAEDTDKAKNTDEMKAAERTEKSKKEKKHREPKEGNEKKGKKEKKSTKEPPIKFKPVEAPKIGYMFETPQRQTARAPSPCPSVAASSKVLTSREKAEKKLQELTAVLNSSDLDDESCPATDLEQFMEDAKMASESDSEEEQAKEKEDADEKSEGSSSEEGKEDAEQVGSDSEDASSDGEEEEESEEETECETETEDEEEGSKQKDDREKQKEKETGGRKVTDDEQTTSEKKVTEGKDPSQHALVPVTEDTANQQVALRNSSTNKNEWDKFCRQAKGKMPASLSEYYQSSKVELFNLWIDSGHDWNKCQLQVERINQQKNIATRGWQAIQGKELKKRYTEEKWQQVKESRRKAGLYYEDDDFPGDEDECWYFTKEGQKFTRKDITGESMKLQAKKDVDPDLRAALVDSEDGLMKAGALPKVSSASAAGSKALLDSIEKVTTVPKKKKNADEDTSSKPVEPATLAEKVASALPTVLKSSSDARTASIKLGTTEYAGELAKQLLDHAQKLEQLYTKMSEATSPGSSATDKDLKALVNKLESLTAFGAKAQTAAEAFLKPKKAKTGKGKTSKRKDKTSK